MPQTAADAPGGAGGTHVAVAEAREGPCGGSRGVGRVREGHRKSFQDVLGRFRRSHFSSFLVHFDRGISDRGHGSPLPYLFAEDCRRRPQTLQEGPEARR